MNKDDYVVICVCILFNEVVGYVIGFYEDFYNIINIYYIETKLMNPILLGRGFAIGKSNKNLKFEVSST